FGVYVECRLDTKFRSSRGDRVPPRADEADLPELRANSLNTGQEFPAHLAPSPPVVPDIQDIEPLFWACIGRNARIGVIAVEKQPGDLGLTRSKCWLKDLVCHDLIVRKPLCA